MDILRHSHHYEQIFQRVFLDTNIVHCLVKYGEQIFDNQDVLIDKKLSESKNSMKNINSLSGLFRFPKSNFQLIMSSNVLEEVIAKCDSHHTQYAFELYDYCYNRSEYSDNFKVLYDDACQYILEHFNTKIGFLSNSDRQLIFDAIRLRCKYFMTIDEKLLKNTTQIKKFTKITLVSPFEYMNIVKPYLSLIA